MSGIKFTENAIAVKMCLIRTVLAEVHNTAGMNQDRGQLIRSNNPK